MPQEGGDSDPDSDTATLTGFAHSSVNAESTEVSRPEPLHGRKDVVASLHFLVLYGGPERPDDGM